MNQGNDKKSRVRDMFNNIAPTYDVLNHTLSFNIDKIWRRRVVKRVAALTPQMVLDVATGTGDLAIAVAKGCPQARVVGVDMSERMLDVAREKVAAANMSERVELVVGDAESLPQGDAEFDVVTVGFGVRNFGDLEGGIRQMHRVLRSGGRLVVLEFSTPENRLWAAVYGFYSHRLLPFVGGLISRDRSAYEYLPRSVDGFLAPEAFSDLMRECGFERVEAQSLSMGIAHIYIGIKR